MSVLGVTLLFRLLCRKYGRAKVIFGGTKIESIRVCEGSKACGSSWLKDIFRSSARNKALAIFFHEMVGRTSKKDSKTSVGVVEKDNDKLRHHQFRNFVY